MGNSKKAYIFIGTTGKRYFWGLIISDSDKSIYCKEDKGRYKAIQTAIDKAFQRACFVCMCSGGQLIEEAYL
jgi:hypothetical protein